MALDVLKSDHTVNVNDLARLALVASDASYAGARLAMGAPLQPFPDSEGTEIPCPYESEILGSGYEVVRPIEHRPTGFKYIVFRNFATNDVIVAFAGTDGANPVDWWGNGFHYGWNQWDANTTEVLGFLAGLQGAGGSAFTGRIHFTGQSLGGALAQYAAYALIAQRKAVNNSYLPSDLTLTTFNSLGGVAALKAEITNFNHDLVTGMGSIRHYYTPNDIVVRLGEGHLGASAHQLSFRPGGVLPGTTNTLLEFGIIESHGIESGFYRNLREQYPEPFDGDLGWFRIGRPQQVHYLQIPALQKAASFFGNPLKGRSAGTVDAVLRLAGGVLFAPLAAPGKEINTLVWALADHARRADSIGEEAHAFLRRIDWGTASKVVGAIAAVVSPIKLVTTWVGSVVLGALASGLRLSASSTVQSIQNEFGATDTPISPNLRPFSEHEQQLKILDGRVSAPQGSTLASIDLEGLAEQLGSGAGWQERSLKYVQMRTGLSGAALVALDVGFGALMYDTALTSKSGDETYPDQVFEVLRSHFEDGGKSIGNSNVDLALKYANADPSVFGTTTDFVYYDAVHDALEQAAMDTDVTRIKELIEREIEIVEEAGQVVVLSKDRPSVTLFDAVGFNPNAYVLPNAALVEGSVSTLTAYLPYEAGEGGQSIQFELMGAAADKLSVLSGTAEVPLNADGTFTLTIPEGQREVSFGLLAAADIDADATLTLSATLVNEAGEATHLTHEEATIELQGEIEAPPAAGREIRGDWAPRPDINPQTGEPYIDPRTGGPMYVRDDLGNIERLPNVPSSGDVELDGILNGSAGGDHIVTGDFDEHAYSYGGDDWIQGSANTGNLILGGLGDDWIEAGGNANHALDYWEPVFDSIRLKLGDDQIHGGPGDDRIYGDRESTVGSLYDATLAPTGLPGDWINGGSGADHLYGSGGDDVLLGGSGVDQLIGGAGMDVLLGDDSFGLAREGNFWRVLHVNFSDPRFNNFEVGLFPVYNYAQLFADPYGIDPNVQAPYLSYYKDGGGDDTLIGGAGKDILIGQLGDDTLYGGADDDILAGWEGEDQIYGGAGADRIAGDFGRYEQPEQRQLPAAYLGIAGLVSAPGFDASTVEQTGDDFLDGGAGNDTIFGEGGDDVVLGGEGADTLHGDASYLPEALHGADQLDGGLGDDILMAYAGDDRLHGGAGEDSLEGGKGDDLLDGGPGNDTLAGDEGADTLVGRSGNDRLAGGAGNDNLRGDEGDDVLLGEAGSDVLSGGVGADQLDGGEGDDTLSGGSGGDVLTGGDGNDLIDGGVGIDVVRGGPGDDTYVLDFGYGRDLIEDVAGRNRILLRAGIAPEDLESEWAGSVLSVNYAFSDDVASLDMAQFQLAGVEFADGTAWTLKNFLDAAPPIQGLGQGAADVLVGASFARNELRGLEGDDHITGARFDDLLSGGDGADSLDGGGGSDTYFFGAAEPGIDRIADSAPETRAYLDWFYGSLGIDDWEPRAEHGGTYQAEYIGDDGSAFAYFASYDQAFANYPSATITYIEPLPQGAPLVTRDDTATLSELTAAGVLGNDAVEFGPGIALADISLTVTVNAAEAAAHPEQPWRAGGTLAVRWGSAGFDLDVPAVDYGYSGTGLPRRFESYRLGAGIETFRFDDGSSYTLEEILQKASVAQVVAPYRFARDSGIQQIANAYAAVAFEDGIRADEVTISRDGSDLLLALADGSVGRIAGWYADPDNLPQLSLQFELDPPLDSAALTAAGLVAFGTDAADTLAGLDGFADTLVGGLGDDTLAGGTGIDTYRFSRGDGADTILDPDSSSVLEFGPGIHPWDLQLALGSLVLDLGAGDAVRFPVFDAEDPFATPLFAELRFDDGTVLGDDDVLQLGFQVTGTNGDDVLTGTALSDSMYGGAGNDTLDGRASGDYLSGGAGDDTYLFGRGSGRDTVSDIEGWEEGDPGAQDTVALGADLSPQDLVITQTGDGRLVLAIGGTADRIDFDESLGDAARIERFTFADGTVWDRAQIEAHIGPGMASAFDDVLTGTEGDDVTHALAGDDEIHGREGNDLLSGNEDSDFLEDAQGHNALLGGEGDDGFNVSGGASFVAGGAGADSISVLGGSAVVAFNSGDGQDSIQAGGGQALTLSLGGGASAGDIRLAASEYDFQLRLGAADAIGISIFAFDEQYWPSATLQIVGPEIRTHDLNAVVADFHAARAADPGFAEWAAAESLAAHEVSSSTTHALGGAIAWQYATAGGLETLTVSQAQSVLSDEQFGIAPQPIAPEGANHAPMVAAPIDSQSATEDEPFAFTVAPDTFADEDPGDTLVLRADLASGDALPAWLEFEPVTGAFAGTPGNADVGVLRVRITALDAAGASASAEFDLGVLNANDAPLASAPITSQTLAAGERLDFTLPAGAFADPDAGDVLTLSARLAGGAALPGWLAFESTSGGFVATPANDAIGHWRVDVTATDIAGAGATSSFNLIVTTAAGATATGDAGNDVLFGSDGNETLIGRRGDDFLAGLEGDDLLRGGQGADVLQGGAGSDVLRAGLGQNLLDGGAGNDILYGGPGASVLAGGTGDDIIRAGRGSDLILFNRGDGNDTLFADRGADNTLSLGGIRTQDLTLRKIGRDLVLDVGASESITFRNWYGGRTSLANLQIVTDSTADYDPDSLDPLLNRRVASFDFMGIVSAFDQARAAQPGLSSWALTHALADFHLSGTDGAALGGDLAYRYATRGTFEGLSLAAAQDVLRSSDLGRQAQALRPLGGLQEGFVTLVA